MDKIIKTVLGKSDEKYYRYVELLLDVEKRMLISPQEEKLLEFLRESFENSGTLPTEEFVVSKFPEYKVPLSSAHEISLHDLRVEYYNLITQRTNQNASRELMKIAQEVSQAGLTYDHMDRVRQYLRLTDEEEIVDVTDSPESFRDYYQKKKEQPQGMRTYIRQIDDNIGGLGYGMLMVLMGYVAQYKSTLALNIVYNNAKKLKYNICMISLEMPKEDILFNFLCRHSYEPEFSEHAFIPAKKIRQCELSEEEEAYVFGQVLDDFYDPSKGMIKILDETDFKTLSFGEIRAKLEEVDDEMFEKTGYGLDAVVVDHIGLLKFNGTGRHDIDGNDYVSFFRKLGISFRKSEDGTMRKLMTILLAQVNREGYKRAEKNKGRYDLRAIAEFNELERAGQVIVSIFTDEDMKLAKEAVACLLKNRYGATIADTISVYADPESQVVGEEMEGFSTVMNMDELDSAFSGDFDITSLI